MTILGDSCMISTSWQRTKSQSVPQRTWISLSHQSLPKRCIIHQILRRHVHLPHPLNDCSRVTDTDWLIGTSTSTLHRILPPRSEMSSSTSRTNSSTMASTWTLKISWSICSRFRNGSRSNLMITFFSPIELTFVKIRSVTLPEVYCQAPEKKVS